MDALSKGEKGNGLCIWLIIWLPSWPFNFHDGISLQTPRIMQRWHLEWLISYLFDWACWGSWFSYVKIRLWGMMSSWECCRWCKRGSMLREGLLTRTHLVLPCSRCMRSRWWNLAGRGKSGRRGQCRPTGKCWASRGLGTWSYRHPHQLRRPWSGSLSLLWLLWTWWIYLDRNYYCRTQTNNYNWLI